MKSKEVRRLKFSGDAEFGLFLSHTDELISFCSALSAWINLDFKNYSLSTLLLDLKVAVT